MDDDLREPLKKTRLLGWATAGLLTAAVVSAGTVAARDDSATSLRTVTAAGAGAEGFEVPTTVTFVPPPLPPAVPPPTTTTPAPTTTTVARPTTTTTTTQAPRTTTTTTKAPVVTTTPTTVAPVTGGVTLTVVNQHPMAVKLVVNGRTYTLAPGEQSGPSPITRYSHGNDIVEASLVAEPSCGMGDADGYFPAPGSYRLTVVASQGLCQPGMPGPQIKVTKA